MFFSISVVYIKEEPKDAASLVKIEPEIKPLVVTGNVFNGTIYSMDEINIKEEPLQDDLVSELLNRKILHRNFHWCTFFFICSYFNFSHDNFLWIINHTKSNEILP